MGNEYTYPETVNGKEVPPIVNGWYYSGGLGASWHNWIDDLQDPSQGVGVMKQCSHPGHESRSEVRVVHVSDMDNKIESKNILLRFVGDRYRTDNKKLNYMEDDAVKEAVKWMYENSPE
jgi:hypothetical protein